MVIFHSFLYVYQRVAQHHPPSPGSSRATRPPVQLVHQAFLRQLRATEAHGEAQRAPEVIAEVARRFLLSGEEHLEDWLGGLIPSPYY